MTKNVMILFGIVFAITIGHYMVDTTSWQHTQLFGGFLNPQTPYRVQPYLLGELSFPTWIFHWSMVIDYVIMLRYMWRWGDDDCTGNYRWKLFALSNIPACIINGVVMLNHLHRDQLVFLKVLHPLLVFVGSIATMFGAYAVAHANGWKVVGSEKDGSVDGFSKVASKTASTNDDCSAVFEWDTSYTLASIFVGSLFAYGSLYLVR